MLYLSLGFCIVWVCHFGYLLAIDRQVRQLHRRLEARAGASPGGA
jgi:CcmD family protein